MTQKDVFRGGGYPFAAAAMAVIMSMSMVASAAVITDDDIVEDPFPRTPVIRDLMLFTGGSDPLLENSYESTDLDDANNDLATGGGPSGSSSSEAYITSIGDLRAFYQRAYPGVNAKEIVLVFDVNETGQDGAVSLDTLDLVLNPTDVYGDSRDTPGAGDVTTGDQNATDSAVTGGTLLSSLDSAKTLAEAPTSGANSDVLIHTGVDAFDAAFSDSDRIVFFIEISGQNNGTERVWVSGIPEPTTAVIALAGVGVLGLRRTRRG